MIGGIPARVLFILIVELCERFCFYNIQGSQKFFLSQKLNYNQAQSTSITNVFNTACYLTCLFGGVLGDRFLGRFTTIASLSALYVAGTFALAFATEPSINSSTLFFIGAFAGVAVGTGGIKPNVSNFGADQVADTGDGADQARERYFAYFYWMINVGAAVGLGLMPTLATDPKAFGIREDMGFFVSYLCAAIAMAVCLGIFLCGSCTYLNKFLTVRVKIFRMVWSTLVYSARRSFRGAISLAGWLLLIPFFALSFVQAFAPSDSDLAKYLAWAAFGIALFQLACLVWAHCDNTFLVTDPRTQALQDALPTDGDETTIEDIRLTFQTIPILLVANTVFNFAYTMMIGPFLSESCQMNLKLGSGQINGAFFNLGDTFAIIAFIPVLDYCIYPFVERRLRRPVSVSEKLLGGFFWAALGMISATGLELLRRNSSVLAPPGWSPDAPVSQRFPNMTFSGSEYEDHYSTLMGQCIINGVQYCSNCAPKVGWPFSESGASTQYNAGIYMSDISGWYMFVPFSFIGIGEIMVNPVLYYYAYKMTPKKSRSVIQAINLVFQGAYPPALVGVFSTVLASAQPNNLNLGHIEWFYYISLVLIVVGTPIFFGVIKACQLQPPRDQEVEVAIPTSVSVHSMRDPSGSFIMSVPERGEREQL